jgi:hypothetical protein
MKKAQFGGSISEKIILAFRFARHYNGFEKSKTK